MQLAYLGAESYRLSLLTQLQDELVSAGYERIAGVDEAGRGSLAGPVVAAAVLADRNCLVPGVDDSKRLRPEQREALAERIRETAVAYAVAAVPAAAIDRTNILAATRRAMGEALDGLHPEPDLIVADAVALDRPAHQPCLGVVRADALCYAVACASILAKVERDRMLRKMGAVYPHYGFEAHKGYASRQHIEALRIFGPCREHRLTFGAVLPVEARA